MPDHQGEQHTPVSITTLQDLTARLSQASDASLDRELLQQALSALNEVLESTQQRIAYEESLNKITSALQQQADLGTILQQTLVELGQVLGASQSRLRLQITPPESTDSPARR